MASYRPLGPFPQYLLSDGTVNNGGLVNFYQTDLTTPQNTWSDPALTVLNANPVVLDASGRPTTDIWGSAAYGVVITDSLGANPRTFNNIQPEAGTGATIPSLVAGEFLTNNSSVLQWSAIRQLADPTGFPSGSLLTTDGTLIYWAAAAASGSSGTAGLIKVGTQTIQWGTATAPQPSSGSHTTTVTVTFPTAFSGTAQCSINYTGGSATAVGGNPIQRSSPTASNVVVQFDINDFSNVSGGINTSLPFSWIAIGPT